MASVMPVKTESELEREGFKRIVANYSGRCSYCHQSYSSGEAIYWKNVPQTTVCCPRCYRPGLRKEVECPMCGHKFSVEV